MTGVRVSLEGGRLDEALPRLAAVAAEDVVAGGDVDPVEGLGRLDGGDAEADIRVARPRVDGQPRGRRQLARAAQVGTAARRAVGRPLPDVAREVERAAGRGAGGMPAGA